MNEEKIRNRGRKPFREPAELPAWTHKCQLPPPRSLLSMTSTICTQCKQPLALDTSLVDLAPSAYDMMASSLPQTLRQHYPSEKEKLEQLVAPNSLKTVWQNAAISPANNLSQRAQEKRREPGISIPGESFVLLQDSVVQNIPTQPTKSQRTPLSIAKNVVPTAVAVSLNKKQSNDPPLASQTTPPQPPPADLATAPTLSPLSHHLESTARIFKLLSSRTDLDHPLCAECTHLVIAILNRQLEETKKERDGYQAFEKEIRKEREREERSLGISNMQEKIDKLKEEERKAIEELKTAEAERARLDEEIRALEREERQLEEEEAE